VYDGVPKNALLNANDSGVPETQAIVPIVLVFNNVNTPVVELNLNNFKVGVISPSKLVKVTLKVPLQIISINASLSMQFNGSDVRFQIVKNLPKFSKAADGSVANSEQCLWRLLRVAVQD